MPTDRRDKRKRRPHLAPVMNSERKRFLRAELGARDGTDCFYCLQPLLADQSIEHLENWATGGSNDLDNLVLAHVDCNWATKDLSVDEKMLRRGDMLLGRMALQCERVAA